MKKIRFDIDRLSCDETEQESFFNNRRRDAFEEYKDLNIEVVKNRIFLSVLGGVAFAFINSFDQPADVVFSMLSWITLIAIIMCFWYFGNRTGEFRQIIIELNEEEDEYSHRCQMVRTMNTLSNMSDTEKKDIDENNEILLKYFDDKMSEKDWDLVPGKDIDSFKFSFYVSLSGLIQHLKLLKETFKELYRDSELHSFVAKYSLDENVNQSDSIAQPQLGYEALNVMYDNLEKDIDKYRTMSYSFTGYLDIEESPEYLNRHK